MKTRINIRRSQIPGLSTGRIRQLISGILRRLIYTTNTIDGFNRQLRNVTKSKSVFPSDDSLLKMLYLAMIDITKNGLVIARIGDRSIPS